MQVAIVGSGPAGCYLAQSLLRALPHAQITVFDRLASPYGLIRYGVAADHQHTKAITRQFERVFQSPNVRFAGGIELGRDISLDELRTHFDAAVLATGLSADRRLGIPGDTLPGVIGAGTVTRMLNAHPDETAQFLTLGDDIVIVGAGNVALDLLRFLVKDRKHYDASDIADPALEQYASAPAQRITLVSRSVAALSKGDPQMIRELAKLPRARYALHQDSRELAELPPSHELDRTEASRVAAFEELVSAARENWGGPLVTLCFGYAPEQIIGSHGVSSIVFNAGDASLSFPCSTVLTAIGFAPAPAEVAGEPAETGRIEVGVYRSGWAKRGPRGGIPENRSCAKAVAAEIVADIESGALKASTDKLGFDGLCAEIQAQAVTYEQWLTLEAYEREHAPADRVRRKIADHDRMIAIARGESTPPNAF